MRLNWNGCGRLGAGSLHYDVTAALPDLHKAMPLQNLAELRGRKIRAA
jgi:hypothetical protein